MQPMCSLQCVPSIASSAWGKRCAPPSIHERKVHRSGSAPLLPTSGMSATSIALRTIGCAIRASQALAGTSPVTYQVAPMRKYTGERPASNRCVMPCISSPGNRRCRSRGPKPTINANGQRAKVIVWHLEHSPMSGSGLFTPYGIPMPSMRRRRLRLLNRSMVTKRRNLAKISVRLFATHPPQSIQ